MSLNCLSKVTLNSCGGRQELGGCLPSVFNGIFKSSLLPRPALSSSTAPFLFAVLDGSYKPGIFSTKNKKDEAKERSD